MREERLRIAAWTVRHRFDVAVDDSNALQVAAQQDSQIEMRLVVAGHDAGWLNGLCSSHYFVTDFKAS